MVSILVKLLTNTVSQNLNSLHLKKKERVAASHYKNHLNSLQTKFVVEPTLKGIKVVRKQKTFKKDSLSNYNQKKDCSIFPKRDKSARLKEMPFHLLSFLITVKTLKLKKRTVRNF